MSSYYDNNDGHMINYGNQSDGNRLVAEYHHHLASIENIIENLQNSSNKNRRSDRPGGNLNIPENKTNKPENDVECEYVDKLHLVFYVTSCFCHSGLLSPTGIPSLIFLNSQDGILIEAEAEFLLLRDELYHRINNFVLRKALLYEDRLMHTSYNIAALKNFNDINIDDALNVVRHLGMKSLENERLYHTALFMRALRHSFAKGEPERVITLIGLIEGLKRNNRFDSIAAAEVEHMFKTICSFTSIQEISTILEDAILGDESIDLDIQLKHAIRKSTAIGKKSQEAEQLVSICNAILYLQEARRSCAKERIEAALVQIREKDFKETAVCTAIALKRLDQIVEDCHIFISSLYSWEPTHFDFTGKRSQTTSKADSKGEGSGSVFTGGANNTLTTVYDKKTGQSVITGSVDARAQLRAKLQAQELREKNTGDIEEKPAGSNPSSSSPFNFFTLCYTTEKAIKQALGGTVAMPGSEASVEVHTNGVLHELIENIVNSKEEAYNMDSGEYPTRSLFSVSPI